MSLLFPKVRLILSLKACYQSFEVQIMNVFQISYCNKFTLLDNYYFNFLNA